MIAELIEENRSYRRFYQNQSDLLNIPAQFKILLVIAIGKPKEKIVLEPVGPDGNIRYWRDSEDVHHVPKRTINEVIIAEY
ncbi:MAG: hypothetical protein HKO68_12875 [Desulfobacterales bacterium]|nr:hypothetical protein [Deltaproteobacteria bacterium]NNL77222.1 hypothetical protein [Desulfobacterales bacterium]